VAAMISALSPNFQSFRKIAKVLQTSGFSPVSTTMVKKQITDLYSIAGIAIFLPVSTVVFVKSHKKKLQPHCTVAGISAVADVPAVADISTYYFHFCFCWHRFFPSILPLLTSLYSCGSQCCCG
jgi:hypothetical protein